MAVEDDTLPAPAPEPDRPQALVVVGRDQYQILGELARGGLGRILRARDLRTGRLVAIKEMLRAGEDARFAFEAILTANLQHPATIPVYEVGRWPSGEPFYAMKLVSGRSLEDVVAEADGLRARLALLPHVVAVAEALAYAHSERVIHRDLKPANVLVGAYGETVVIDWGLAKNLATGEAGASAPAAPLAAAKHGETIAGTVLGTPAYMSPEQARGDPVDERTDVYAIGAMLYQVLSGVRPYAEAVTPDEVLDKVVVGPPRALAEIDPDIPAELVAICDKAMAIHAADRYPAATVLAEDLKRFTTGQLVSAHRYTAWQLVRRWIARHRAVVIASALAVVALALLGGYSVRRIVAERDVAESRRREAELRLGELFAEQGRQALAAGDSPRALAWLAEAMRRGATDAGTRFLAGQALIGMAPLEAVLGGHAQAVMSVQFSPDGQRLLSAGMDSRVALWDLARRQVVVAVPGGYIARFTPDGKSVVTANVYGPIMVWDARLLVPRGAVFLPKNENPYALAVARDGSFFAAAGVGGSVGWWRTDTLEPIAQVSGGGRLMSLDIRADGQRIVGSGDAGRVEIWNRDGTPALRLEGHAGIVARAVFSPDGALVATAGDDKRAILWDAATGAIRFRLAHEAGVSWVAFDPTGTRLASASVDKTAVVWDVATGEKLLTLSGHASNVNTAHFSADGKRILTAGEDGVAKVWDAASGALQATYVHTTQPLADAVFSDDGRRVATAGYDARARVWRVDAAPRVVHLDAEPPIQAGTFSTDGKWVAIAAKDGLVSIFDPRTGARRHVLPRTPTVRNLAFSPDGTRLATAMRDGAVRVWDTAKWASEDRLQAHTKGDARVAAWDPRGARIVTTGDDAMVRVWDAATLKAVLELGPMRGPGQTAAFSPDGTRIAATCEGYEAYLWDAGSGALLATLPFKGKRVMSLAFSPDGSLFAAGAWMPPPVVYRSADGSVQARLVGHAAFPIPDLDFSPDGARVLTAGGDATVRLWDARSGAQIFLADTPQNANMAARFRPDGALFAAASLDDTVRIWDAASGRLLASVPDLGKPYSIRFSPDGTRLLVNPLAAAPVLWRVDTFAGDAAELARRVRCYVPFKVVGSGLEPATPESSECASPGED